LIVNLSGCFALGIVVQLAVAGAWHGDARAAIAAGFLGGYTTYSSFNQETIAMFTSGATSAALANIAITLAGGLAAGALGAAAARLVQS
jgi:CrcB protein